MRAALVILAVALPASARADRAMRFDAGLVLRSGNEAGQLDGMTVAYPFDDKGAAFRFDVDVDDAVRTDRGGTIGVRFGGGFEYTARHTTTAPEDPSMISTVADKVRFVINGGTLLPLVRRDKLRIDAHGSIDVILAGGISAGLDVGARVWWHPLRVEYDLRPFHLGGDNRVEHRLAVVARPGRIGLRAEAFLGDVRGREGGYRYQGVVLGIEVSR